MSLPVVGPAGGGARLSAAITVAPPVVKVTKPAAVAPRVQDPASSKTSRSLPLPKTRSTSVSESAATRLADKFRVLPRPARLIASTPLMEPSEAAEMLPPMEPSKESVSLPSLSLICSVKLVLLAT